jgi:tRNA(fMet)-specific endonuclease VapC
MGALDLMIAAHALALNVKVVTHDRAFERIPKLRTADWTT